MLIKQKALKNIGGLARIKNALIDDCSLAHAVKNDGGDDNTPGKIRLAHTHNVHSLRVYPDFKSINDMIARTAFTQLRYSPLAFAWHLAGVKPALPCADRLYRLRHNRIDLCGLGDVVFNDGPLCSHYIVLWLAPRLRRLVAGRSGMLYVRHLRLRQALLARSGRSLEGSRTGFVMTDQTISPPSGKNKDNENFPVGSLLIRPDLREHVHAFYDFARAADDISDDPLMDPNEKIARLDQFAAVLTGADNQIIPSVVGLRKSLQATGITPQHSLDLLTAFKRDATQLRYDDWADLMDYCRYSASPVGRHVLALHGIGEKAWPTKRRALLGLAGHQSPSGLRRRLSRTRPRLSAC